MLRLLVLPFLAFAAYAKMNEMGSLRTFFAKRGFKRRDRSANERAAKTLKCFAKT